MYIKIYIYLFMYKYRDMCIYIYIYIYVCMFMCVYMYIHTWAAREMGVTGVDTPHDWMRTLSSSRVCTSSVGDLLLRFWYGV